jgi:hypothetical protein
LLLIGSTVFLPACPAYRRSSGQPTGSNPIIRSLVIKPLPPIGTDIILKHLRLRDALPQAERDYNPQKVRAAVRVIEDLYWSQFSLRVRVVAQVNKLTPNTVEVNPSLNRKPEV